jgi:hypothetical protein
MLLTPSRYWRVPAVATDYPGGPPREYVLPAALAGQSRPPRAGHGITLASYDDETECGHLHWIGHIQNVDGATATVDWRDCQASIWCDTGYGRSKWRKGSFGFAESKNTGYGLHALWCQHFPDMEERDELPLQQKPCRLASRSRIDRSRLDPVEVVGAPSDAPRAGLVYVLRSAYGVKVGRTSNLQARMREFGVKLPFIYNIPLVAWFENCHEAERRYHALFDAKRINGEWFDLDENDISLIRARTFDR